MLNKSLIFVNTSPAGIRSQHQQPEGTGRKPASSEHPVTSEHQKMWCILTGTPHFNNQIWKILGVYGFQQLTATRWVIGSLNRTMHSIVQLIAEQVLLLVDNLAISVD